MATHDYLNDLIKNFNTQNLISLFYELSSDFAQLEDEIDNIHIPHFQVPLLVGSLLVGLDNLCVVSSKLDIHLTERSSKKAQFDFARKFLKNELTYSGGFFVFYDESGNFRFSFIHKEITKAGKEEYSNFKRYTYFVEKDKPNKTFRTQLSGIKFKNINEIKQAFSLKKISEEFYSEIQNWYFWALDNVNFPNPNDEKNSNSKSLIRLITRLIFVWFMKEKKLIPNEIFDKDYLDNLINFKDKTNSTYYKAILQNLFFATLNTEMQKDNSKSRIFLEDARQFGHISDGHLQQGFYRYSRFIKDKNKFIKLYENIPFLNGGLFESLDKSNEERFDCFSDNPSNESKLSVPDFLFLLTNPRIVDISKYFDEKKNKSKNGIMVKGIIEILKDYNFTVDENSPIDLEVALDPELLGKIFENLLAAYNPETATSARKSSGSFYTPREIVDYMVEEALSAYFENKLNDKYPNERPYNFDIKQLLSYSDEQHKFTPNEVQTLIDAINSIKILDPACGSGAFPMGILHKLVWVLHKLDPDNEQWKDKILERIPDDNTRNEVKNSLNNKSWDYIRKLGLIQSCIFGVDIQEIAVQISKLRFFISLLIEQEPEYNQKNLGIKPLPNLETKFVAANTLIGLEEDKGLKNKEVEEAENQLFKIRKEIFYANSSAKKKKLQEKEKTARQALKNVLINRNFMNKTADKIANWDPFDQNASSDWFDPEWMYGINDGFDIVIGNPPYKILPANHELISYFRQNYRCCTGGKINLYKLFFEKGLQMLIKQGTLSFITPFNYLSSHDSLSLRKILLKETTIKEIIDYEEAEKVFASVTQAVATIITSKTKPYDYSFNYLKKGIRHRLYSDQILRDTDLLIKGNNPVIEKIRQQKHIFDDLVLGWQGEINVSTKKEFFSNYKNIGHLPLIRGNQIGLYQLLAKSNEFCPTSISTRDHYKFRRIVFQEVSNSGLTRRVKGVILENILCGHTTNYIIPKIESQPLEAILGLLNSKLINYYFKFYNQTNHVPIGEIKKIPFPDDFISNSKNISSLVIRILSEKKANLNADTSALEKQIDKMVYKLYDLTEEEIKIIENNETK